MKKSFIPAKVFHPVDVNEFKGDNVFCVICKSTFRIFAPHGIVQRQNARCLFCHSLERHRLLWKFLNEKTNFSTGRNLKVLHFAPEIALHYFFSRMQNLRYTPCDIAPERYPFNDEPKVEKVDITAVPFKDNTFDVILCSHVLEHIPNDHLAMTELYRVLKMDGWGILQVPIDQDRQNTYEDMTITTPEERERAFGQYDHVRSYGDQDYRARLTKVGFDVRPDFYVKSFNEGEIFKYGFDRNEIIYYCKK